MGNTKLKTFLFVGLLLFLGYSLSNNLLLLFKARETLSVAQKNLEKVSEENHKLAQKLGEVEKTIYIEKIARDTLGLAQPTELVLVLPQAEDLKKLSPRVFLQKDAKEEVSIPPWKQWLQLFI